MTPPHYQKAGYGPESEEDFYIFNKTKEVEHSNTFYQHDV